MKKDTLITVLILVGLVLGAILGQILHMNLGEGEALNPIWMDLGDIVLIRPLKLMVIPLVFLSLWPQITFAAGFTAYAVAGPITASLRRIRSGSSTESGAD